MRQINLPRPEIVKLAIKNLCFYRVNFIKSQINFNKIQKKYFQFSKKINLAQKTL